MKRKDKGFTLIELVLVLLITAILMGIAIPIYQYFLKKAKQVEAQLALKEIVRLERMYFADHDRYSDSISEIGFSPMQPLNYYTIAIEPISDPNKFTARAEGNLDGDPDLDIWLINEKEIIIHLAED
ncbi:MAG: prepilin-type N-terminal cleavage/methylation domain-containing protein [Nitrospirae bacterium]|nr:prepilin-type N-terminal cleavage/methylation domain-containing protein [Nitrospirota bacterium]